MCERREGGEELALHGSHVQCIGVSPSLPVHPSLWASVTPAQVAVCVVAEHSSWSLYPPALLFATAAAAFKPAQRAAATTVS